MGWACYDYWRRRVESRFSPQSRRRVDDLSGMVDRQRLEPLSLSVTQLPDNHHVSISSPVDRQAALRTMIDVFRIGIRLWGQVGGRVDEGIGGRGGREKEKKGGYGAGWWSRNRKWKKCNCLLIDVCRRDGIGGRHIGHLNVNDGKKYLMFATMQRKKHIRVVMSSTMSSRLTMLQWLRKIFIKLVEIMVKSHLER